MKTKKVFSADKWFDRLYEANKESGEFKIIEDSIECRWPFKCEGKTAIEMEGLGFGCCDGWFIEVEDTEASE